MRKKFVWERGDVEIIHKQKKKQREKDTESLSASQIPTKIPSKK